MGDRNAAMLQALQQLTRQRQPQQQSNGRPSLNSIIEMVSRSCSKKPNNDTSSVCLIF